MKKNVITLTIILFTLISCSSDEKPIDIFLNAPKGALLINTEIGNDNFVMTDLESTFSVEVRANDEKQGEFFDFVRVYIGFQSNTSNGGISRDEVVLRDIPRSEFYSGEFGRPRTLLDYSFQEALDALELTINDVAPGDQFFIRPDMHLKDGRIIGYINRSPSIIADFCENSPFYYQINVITPIPDDLYTGTYNYELIASTNTAAVPESGVTTIIRGDYANQRRSGFLDFTVAGDFILPDIYQERGGLCRFGAGIVFWGPQDTSFGLLDLQDDSVFVADFTMGYDGWVGGDLSLEPIKVTYRFSKQ
jgi:hypothetical protein